MKSFYKRLNSGWSRLLHVLLSMGLGLFGLVIALPMVGDVGAILGGVVGIVIYQPLAYTALWVFDGFKSKNNRVESGLTEAQKETPDRGANSNEQTKSALKQGFKVDYLSKELRITLAALKLIAVLYLLPICIFFVCYFFLYWVFVWIFHFGDAFIVILTFVSLIVARLLAKIAKGRLQKS